MLVLQSTAKGPHLSVLHADHSLAARIEHSVVRDLARYAEACGALDPTLRLATAHLAGGLALFVAPGSPVNMLVGAGLDGVVDPADLDALEAFYAQHGTRAAISLCPLADESLIARLGVRGWMLTDFENVLVRELDPATEPWRDVWAPFAPGIDVRVADNSAERALWARISAGAFSAPDEPSAEVLRLGEAGGARQDMTLLIASVDGTDAAAGALWVDGDLGWMLGDATLPAQRCRGAQSALLGERTRLAAAAGCTLAVTEARPGSTSQRNMERLGYSVVYTRVEMIAPPSRRQERP